MQEQLRDGVNVPNELNVPNETNVPNELNVPEDPETAENANQYKRHRYELRVIVQNVLGFKLANNYA